MAFKFKIPRRFYENVYFELAYLWVACGLILGGAFNQQTWICWIGALLLIVPVFAMLLDVWSCVIARDERDDVPKL